MVGSYGTWHGWISSTSHIKNGSTNNDETQKRQSKGKERNEDEQMKNTQRREVRVVVAAVMGDGWEKNANTNRRDNRKFDKTEERCFEGGNVKWIFFCLLFFFAILENLANFKKRLHTQRDRVEGRSEGRIRIRFHFFCVIFCIYKRIWEGVGGALKLKISEIFFAFFK